MTSRFVWTDSRVREALGIEGEPAPTELEFSGVSTDTRTLAGGELFVALEGTHFDGHEFVGEAAARGARAAVVSRSMDPAEELELYSVADTLEGLGDLARYRRRALHGEVIGITGSSGKTTVKELLAAALSGSFAVHATRGNLNNRIGVPLSLLAAPEEADYVVVEMGTSEPGEIGRLTAIAEPDHSILSTVSEAHLEGLGSLEGVLNEKLQLVRDTRPGGSVVVGDEPEALPTAARSIRPDVRVAGLSERADEEFRGEPIGQDEDGEFSFLLWGREIQAGIPGRHGMQNLLLALASARLLGAGEEAAIERATAVGPAPLRGEFKRIGDLRMILDCYNANPQSVASALDLLAELPGESSKVAILGSMLELGDRSEVLHQEILGYALSLPLQTVVAVGEFERAARATLAPGGSLEGISPHLIAATTNAAAYGALKAALQGTETILLKGSRGVALETLVERFQEDFGGGLPDGPSPAPVDEAVFQAGRGSGHRTRGPERSA